MKGIISLLFFSVLTVGYSQDYWQQEVNYKIEVALDDINHLLHAKEEIVYVNNSPDILNEIYMHLWPNAYKNGETALAKQLYKGGTDYLQFGPDSIKGWIDSLAFRVNDKLVSWEYDPIHIDICVLHLEAPLKPGERITISTPFTVKIPSGKISRLGHLGQSYQITQWYPKPAVYDKNGWNAIPYLNQGEFYSEYGSFDVSITLPENYILGVTGDLQTDSEVVFMDSLATETEKWIEKEGYNSDKSNEFPLSSSKLKTVRYTQSVVHDFAWFADKRYKVLKGQADLPFSKRRVTSWALFTPKNAVLWKESIEYLNDAIFYYSKWNGDYPYNQVTAVDGTISAGGGMEYPNVTVIGNSSSAHELEVVIVHEVGHNWFYGILGSNERVHGWMDEGMNTLNEVRYVQTKYPDNTAMSDMLLGGILHLEHLSHYDMGDISYRFIAMLGEDQPIETHSAEYSSANYGIVMYQKTGLVFNYLRAYLGDDKFDSAMRNYYESWKFKHPQPEDMKRSLEKSVGENLDWLFGDLIQTTNHIDYKLSKVKKNKDQGYTITVKNVGQVNGPIGVNSIVNDSIVETTWVTPTDRKATISSSLPQIDAVVIDANGDIPELNRTNNSWVAKGGLLKKFEKPKVEFLLGDHETKFSNAFWTPIIAGNFYDKMMIGAALHNYGVPLNHLQYLVAPMYSFGRNSLSGIAELSYSTQPKSTFKLSRFGISTKTFKNDSTYRNNNSYYVAVSPYWFAKIGNRVKNSPYSNTVKLSPMYRYDQLGSGVTEHVGGYLKYNLAYKTTDHGAGLEFRTDYLSNIENSDEFGRSSLAVDYKYRYAKKKKSRWVELRAYVGGFWNNSFSGPASSSYLLSLTGSNGLQDVFVEDYYFGRGLTSGLWSQQRANNMGGVKSSSSFGATDQWLATGSLYFQLPINPNIFGIYADYGTVRIGSKNFEAINTGIALKIQDIFAVYFPIYMNANLENGFATKNYTERIRFSLKLNVFNNLPNIGNLL